MLDLEKSINAKSDELTDFADTLNISATHFMYSYVCN